MQAHAHDAHRHDSARSAATPAGTPTAPPPPTSTSALAAGYGPVLAALTAVPMSCFQGKHGAGRLTVHCCGWQRAPRPARCWLSMASLCRRWRSARARDRHRRGLAPWLAFVANAVLPEVRLEVEAPHRPGGEPTPAFRFPTSSCAPRRDRCLVARGAGSARRTRSTPARPLLGRTLGRKLIDDGELACASLTALTAPAPLAAGAASTPTGPALTAPPRPAGDTVCAPGRRLAGRRVNRPQRTA